MIHPAKLNLTIYQGSTFYKKFTWKEIDVPIDLTGHTFRMQIRTSVNSDIILASFETATGEFYLESPTDGIFALEISHLQTEALDFNKAVYDIECVFPDSRVSRILYGAVTLSKEVTR